MKTRQTHPALLRIQASYDENSRLSGQSWQMGGKTYSEGFVYDDHGRLTSKSVKQANGVETAITNTYDSLSRLVAQTRPVNRAVYNYLPGANGTTTSLVASVQYSKLNSNSFSPIAFGYAYDELGYITRYGQTGRQDVVYDYDQQGQLTNVSDPNQDLNYTYTYDTYGNIRTAVARGVYHDSDNYTNNYDYDNPKWLDLLTGFNDEPILYEGQSLVNGVITGDPTSGNPISYFNGTRWEFTWQNGRQLASASATEGDTTVDIAYTYDINGLRTSKTITRTTATDDGGDEGSSTTPVPDCNHDLVEVSRTEYYIYYQCSKCGATVQEPIQVDPPVEYGLERNVESVETERHEYVYASGQLLREVITTTDAEGNATTEVLDFTYDASGSPYTLTYTNGAASPVTYYYVVNLQGDVMRLVSANGATVAEYWYGPYGEVLTASGTMAEVNPLRYRGYCYDADTSFYYLQSRYYDPSICRFVNGDGYASTGQGFLGCDMFAYCGNSPTNYCDPGGCAYWGTNTAVYNDDGTPVDLCGPSNVSIVLKERVYALLLDRAYSEKVWNMASRDDRLKILQQFANDCASIMGITSPPISYSSDSAIGSGSYNSETGGIEIKSGLGHRASIQTLLHEIYHAYQYAAMNSSRNGDPFSCKEPRVIVALWAEADATYVDDFIKEYRFYYNNALEIGARWFAGQLDAMQVDASRWRGYLPRAIE